MAGPALDVKNFQLFVPHKSDGSPKDDVTFASYGADMRAIELWAQYLVAKVIPASNAALAAIQAELVTINNIINVLIPKFEFGNVAVGSNPPSGVQFIDYSTTEAITTNGSGEASIALSGFSHGYNALVTANWPGLMASVDMGASTLSTLWLNFQDTTGAYAGKTFAVTVRVVGA